MVADLGREPGQQVLDNHDRVRATRDEIAFDRCVVLCIDVGQLVRLIMHCLDRDTRIPGFPGRSGRATCQTIDQVCWLVGIPQLFGFIGFDHARQGAVQLIALSPEAALFIGDSLAKFLLEVLKCQGASGGHRVILDIAFGLCHSSGLFTQCLDTRLQQLWRVLVIGISADNAIDDPPINQRVHLRPEQLQLFMGGERLDLVVVHHLLEIHMPRGAGRYLFDPVYSRMKHRPLGCALNKGRGQILDQKLRCGARHQQMRRNHCLRGWHVAGAGMIKVECKALAYFMRRPAPVLRLHEVITRHMIALRAGRWIKLQYPRGQ